MRIQAFILDENDVVIQTIQVASTDALSSFPLAEGQRIIVYDGTDNVNNVMPVIADEVVTYEERVVDVEAELFSIRFAKKQEINACRNRYWNGKCLTVMGYVDCDETSRANLYGTIAAANETVAAGEEWEAIYWTMANGEEYELRIEDLRMMGRQVAQFINNVQRGARELKAQLAIASTVEEITSIDVESYPWPE